MSDSPEVSQQTGEHQAHEERARRLEHVDSRVASKVEKMVRDLQDLATAAEEKAVGQLLAATARVDGAETQRDILQALLDEGRRFASRTAFFLTRPGEVRGWSARGFDSEAAAVNGQQFDYEEGSVWARMAQTAGAVALGSEECGEIGRSLDTSPGDHGVLIPLVLRGELGGVLYADRLESQEMLGTASLQLLTHSAAQAIETTAIRGSGSSPTLRSATEGAGPVSLFQPRDEAPAAPAVETPEAAAEEPETASGLGAVAGVVGAVGVAAAALTSSDADASKAAEEASDFEPVVAAPEVEVVDEPQEVFEAPPLDEPEEELTAAVAVVQEEPATEVEEPEDTEEAAEAIDFEMISSTGTDEIEVLAPEELTEDDLEAAAADIEVERTPEPELEDTTELWAADDASTLVEATPQPEVTTESAPLAPPIALDPTVGQETVRLDIAALQGQMPAGSPPIGGLPGVDPVAAAPEFAGVEETAKVPEWDVEPVSEPSAQPEFELEPEEPDFELEPDSEAVTAPMAQPDFAADDISEDPTIMTSRENLGDLSSPPAEPAPMSGGYVPPAPAEVAPPPSTGFAPPPAKPDATGSTQVVPPTDIQGPGSAFGGSEGIPEGEEALHEEARRLARLLVSEIKLYNEEIIEEGRRAGNIYDRLKDDIDRSRQMYEERIDPRLTESGKDYFRSELVQRLAGGDERTLGY